MTEAAKSHILGRVEWIDKDRHCGQIRPLALVKKRPDGEWIVEKEVEDEELGLTSRDFWPRVPNHQLGLAGRYVRLKLASNLYAEDGKDQYVVAGDERNGGGRPVEEIGWPVLAVDHVNGAERVVSPRVGHLPIGATVYRRCLHAPMIDGPWQITQRPGGMSSFLQPKQDGSVLECVISKIPHETYHELGESCRIWHSAARSPARRVGQNARLPCGH